MSSAVCIMGESAGDLKNVSRHLQTIVREMPRQRQKWISEERREQVKDIEAEYGDADEEFVRNSLMNRVGG